MAHGRGDYGNLRYSSLDRITPANVKDLHVISSVDGPSVFTHALCPNTWQNGRKIGEEAKASGY